MAFEDWKKHPNGNVVLCPLMGWDIASFPMTGVVRLGFADGSEALAQMSMSHVQLAMTAPQARELAEALSRLADRVEAQPLGTQQ